MTEEDGIRCPVCGTMNKKDAEKCGMCRTRLAKKEDGSLKVQSPKAGIKAQATIDIEDPITRKKLEELTLIPGVTRHKALILYQAGIHSIEDFLQKALQGERFSANYSRTVANKLLVQSLRGKAKKDAELLCPSCNAPNPVSSKKCKVCNFDIKGDMDSVDVAEIPGNMTDSVSDLLSKLSEFDDFNALPEDMKAQLAVLVESDDVDYETEKPKELDNLGIDLEKLDAEAEEQKAASETENAPAAVTATESQAEPAAVKDAEEPGEQTAKTPAKNDKIRAILEEKMTKWRKAGYDVSTLGEYLGDKEAFKEKAKEVLGKGKVVRQRYAKQLEMWREKGFDVSELEPLLDTDMDLFQERAKEILKKQKK